MLLAAAAASAALAVAVAPPQAQYSWSGPAVRLESSTPGGFPGLRLSGVDAAVPPFWLNLNNQGYPNVSAIAVEITRAREAGLELLAMVLSDVLEGPMNRSFSGATHQMFDLIALHHPTAKVLVRWYLTGPEFGRSLDDPGNMVLQNITNPQQTRPIAVSSPTAAWAAAAAANLSVALSNLDAAFPGRIAGVVIEGLCGGEWFTLPTDWPQEMIADYSPGMLAEFCAAEDPANRGAGCRLPTASERDTPTLGNALLQWTTGSSPSARSFRYNRFISQRVASAIAGFAAVVKNVTARKSFVFAYSGYLFDLSDTRLTYSGHLDLSSLLSDPNLDGIGSPYQYGAYAREPAGRFTSHGPVDSATLNGKVWVTEDDTRTVLTQSSWDKQVNSTEGTVNLVRRNMYTAMLHRHAIYWLDLASNGWWGRADNASMIAATDAIWSNASHVLKQWQALLGSAALQAPLLPAAEVAIFVDEISAAARPILGRGGTVPQGYPFETSLQQLPWQDIAGVGAPVRVFLQSDLLHKDFPFKDIKLAIFLNAFMLSDDLRHIVKTVLQADGRTVAWIYAPGLLDADVCGGSGSCMPSAASSSSLVGLPLEIDTSDAALTTTFQQPLAASNGPVIPASLVNSSYGDQLGLVSPSLSCVEDGAAGTAELVVLGRYGPTMGGKASICWSAKPNYSAVFIGAPRPPLAFWRSLGAKAGVHLYTDGTVGTDDVVTGAHADAVEVAAGGLLFHAGAGVQSGTKRRVQLPRKMAVKSEWGEVVCNAAQPCDSFETPPLRDGESILYWLSVGSLHSLQTDD